MISSQHLISALFSPFIFKVSFQQEEIYSSRELDRPFGLEMVPPHIVYILPGSLIFQSWNCILKSLILFRKVLKTHCWWQGSFQVLWSELRDCYKIYRHLLKSSLMTQNDEISKMLFHMRGCFSKFLYNPLINCFNLI